MVDYARYIEDQWRRLETLSEGGTLGDVDRLVHGIHYDFDSAYKKRCDALVLKRIHDKGLDGVRPGRAYFAGVLRVWRRLTGTEIGDYLRNGAAVIVKTLEGLERHEDHR